MEDVRWLWITAGRQLPGNDMRYVKRPQSGGDELARLVERHLTPIVVTGPPGSGKTMELHRAAYLVRKRSQQRVVHVNWFDDPAEVEPGPFLYKLARHFFEEWTNDIDKAPPTIQMVKDMRASDPYLSQGEGKLLPPRIIARQVFRAYAEAYGIERFALFLDGLDEVPDDRARLVLHKLVEVADVVDLVVVVGPTLSNGPESFEVLSSYRVFHVAALDPVPRSTNQKWMREIALRRVGERKAPTRRIGRALNVAAKLSGGVPGLFLRLLGDSAKYSRDASPGAVQLQTAARDYTNALRRLLVQGDLAALADADGSPGIEVAADRRVRLLSQGMLLEYLEDGQPVVRPHPLLRPFLPVP